MNIQLETTSTVALQEGIVGCLVAAIQVNDYPSLEAYDRIIDAVAGRELFLEADLTKLIKSQTTLHYILEDDFLQSCCEKITEEWKRPVFAIIFHLLIDTGLSTSAIEFLKVLKQKLALQDVNDIVEVLSLLHKDRFTKSHCNI